MASRESSAVSLWMYVMTNNVTAYIFVSSSAAVVFPTTKISTEFRYELHMKFKTNHAIYAEMHSLLFISFAVNICFIDNIFNQDTLIGTILSLKVKAADIGYLLPVQETL